MEKHIKGNLLVRIFQFLSPQTLVNSCLCVDSEWKKASTSNQVWEMHCSQLLMEDCFKWSDQLIYSIKINHDEYWYILFRTLFWFPLFERHVVWYQEEEEHEYYLQTKVQRRQPPKKKRKKVHSDDDSYDSDSDYEQDDMITEFSLETINEFYIPHQFRPHVEVGFRMNGDEFDFDMVYCHAKMASILTAIGSEQYSPNVWNDHLVVSICDSRDKILVSTEMTVAALCLCVRFDNFNDLYERLFDSEKTKTLKLAISTHHNSDRPQCYIEYMDDNAISKNGSFDWVCHRRRNCFLPNHSWETHHGEFTEIRFRAILKDQKVSIEKHSIYTGCP